MKNTVLTTLIKNIALCLATGGMLAACGGDTSGASGHDSILMANGEACNAAWASATAYSGGAKVSYSGVNYTAAYWTQGNNPSTSSGPSGSGQPWITGFTCGTGTTTSTTKATTTTTKATSTTTKATTSSTASTTSTTKASSTTTTTTKATTTTTKATTTTTLGGGTCPAYVAETAYAAGKTVTNAGGYYSCTVAGWCSSGASAYEPGVGWAWTSAWATASVSACGGVTTTNATTSTTKNTTTSTGSTTSSTGGTTTSSTTTTTAVGGVPTKVQAEAVEAALTDNAFFRTIKASIRTLPNASVEAVTPANAANPANVKRVERLLPSAKWDFYFSIRESSYTYQRFLQAIAKFPAICGDYTDGRNADAICKHSLATMFAHFAQETGDHNASIPTPQWRQGLYYLREMGCGETGATCGYNTECSDPVFNKVWTCGKNADGTFKKYFGRGAKQLSYNYNYGPFSQAMNNGDQFALLNNPDLVASTWLNLASATFFFVYPQPPKPSMLHVLDGTWVPNQTDISRGAGNNFATTIMIINAECGQGTEKAAAQNRIDYYKQFSTDLGWDYSTEQLSCATMQRFDGGSSAAYNIYFEKSWTNDYQCQLVSYQTPYNALLAGNYVKCVQDNWGVTLK